ncbi:MAG TPA: SIMPL domain-containing protein [Burkholderiales bacterium]|nr:SIMPL domain-containing protein [Burkholderiales bacterium]
MMTRAGRLPCVGACALLLGALCVGQAAAQGIGPVAAQGGPERRPEVREGRSVIEFQAEAQREIPNDTLTAVFYVEASEAQAAQVADALNRTLNQALTAAKEVKAVRTRSGNSQTYPVYDRSQRLTGWRGRAEMRVDTRDFAAGSALIAKLQSLLQLSSMSFSVSPEARRAAENELIPEAVAAFRARADIVKQALAARDYRIRRMTVSSGGAPAPRPMVMRATAAAAADVAAPQLEGGLSQVSVSVSGAIEVD